MTELVLTVCEYLYSYSNNVLRIMCLPIIGYSIAECRELYWNLKDDVFSSSSKPYDSDAINGCLKNYFGEKTTMDKLKHPK